MKFSINQAELQNALSVVLKGIASRSTLPILSGILIEADGDALTFQATDLTLSTKFTAQALVDEPGRTVVPGKLFSDIVKNLPDAAVHVSSDDDEAIVTCDTSSFSIKTLEASDFPAFPEVLTEQEVSIPFPQFASMVKRVARVVSRDESHAILTGVLVTLEAGLLKMVATDSYRLAVTEVQLEDTTASDFEAVIAGAFLQDIASLPRTEESVRIGLAENQIIVTYQDTVFVNRRIEGNFPNYRQLLPNSYACRAKMRVDALVAAVKRASLLGQSSSPVKVSVSVTSGTVQLSANAQDVGSTQETLSCEAEGEDMDIAFNAGYVIDGLGAINTDEVYLELLSSLKPGILRAAGEENYVYLVMPVRVS